MVRWISLNEDVRASGVQGACGAAAVGDWKSCDVVRHLMSDVDRLVRRGRDAVGADFPNEKNVFAECVVAGGDLPRESCQATVELGP